mgnify:CR=1 FL=1
MNVALKILVAVVALIHVYFAWAEFTGREAKDFYDKFEIMVDKDQDLKEIGRIVANAAIFNALLAVGLVLSLAVGDRGDLLQLYLLGSITIAGIVGGLTLIPLVGVMQSGPAGAALVLAILARRQHRDPVSASDGQ